MPTLLLRLAGPMQSWGADESKFDTRSTRSCPTKSAVIGMVAAAMGRSREDEISDLAALRFGVRLDQVGKVFSDFHYTSNPKKPKSPFVTKRQYLEDSCFLVGLEGSADILSEIVDALRNPYYPISLGRRSCPPAGRIILGIDEGDLDGALRDAPWIASEWFARSKGPSVSLEINVETDSVSGDVLLRDQPISYSQSRRIHTYRPMKKYTCNVKNNHTMVQTSEFDPFSEVKGTI